MAIQLKPESEIVIAATAISIVLAIFDRQTPNVSDVRADKPGNPNTHASVKMAAITSVAAIGSLALLARSPSVFILGGGAILFETWKMHYANHGIDGTKKNAEAGY
jgi:hypothetical protein